MWSAPCERNGAHVFFYVCVFEHTKFQKKKKKLGTESQDARNEESGSTSQIRGSQGVSSSGANITQHRKRKLKTVSKGSSTTRSESKCGKGIHGICAMLKCHMHRDVHKRVEQVCICRYDTPCVQITLPSVLAGVSSPTVTHLQQVMRCGQTHDEDPDGDAGILS